MRALLHLWLDLFLVPSVDKLHPFHIPSVERGIPFNASLYMCRLLNMNKSLNHEVSLPFSQPKMHLLALLGPFADFNDRFI